MTPGGDLRIQSWIWGVDDIVEVLNELAYVLVEVVHGLTVTDRTRVDDADGKVLDDVQVGSGEGGGDQKESNRQGIARPLERRWQRRQVAKAHQSLETC